MKKIMIIPGNPGIPEFYEYFVKSIVSRKSDLDIRVSSHFPDYTKPMSLDEVVERHKQFMETFQPDMIIGHSMGCYIGLRIADQTKLCMVCPAVMDMWLVNGTMTDLSIGIYKIIAPYIHMVPQWLSNYLSGSKYGYKVCNKDAFSCFANLWVDERKQIADLYIPEITDNVQVICSTRDDWTPQYIRNKLRSVFVNFYETDDLSHEFCIKPNECDIVAKLIIL
jgi:hypothetical protein